MKTITQNQFLQALALFTMATHHNAEATKFMGALTSMFDPKDEWRWSDAIFGRDAATVEDFKIVLEALGVTVQPEPETQVHAAEPVGEQ